MTTRTLIKNLAALSDGPVTVSGWVDTVRDQKKVQFVVLRDESGALQFVHPRAEESDPIATTISALGTGTFVTVTGTLKHDERVKLGGIEVLIASLDVVSEALESPIAEDTGVDKRMDWRFLDLRVPKGRARRGTHPVPRHGDGKALEWLRELTAASAVLFIGDDVTDEDGFRVLEAGDVGIKVGTGETAAQFRISDPAEVSELLAELVTVRKRALSDAGGGAD